MARLYLVSDNKSPSPNVPVMFRFLAPQDVCLGMTRSLICPKPHHSGITSTQTAYPVAYRKGNLREPGLVSCEEEMHRDEHPRMDEVWEVEDKTSSGDRDARIRRPTGPLSTR